MDDRPQFDRSDLPRGVSRRDQATANTPPKQADLPPQDQLIADIQSAAFSDQNSALGTLIDTYLQAGLTEVDLCETYIPQAARQLGAQWCEDTLSFAGVTVGCARLVKALRELENRTPPIENLNAPQVLLLVGDDVYHTLGATVLSGILRRAGLGVQLWIGATAEMVKDHMQYTDFDAVFLSASMGESLESLRCLIATVKHAQPGVLTIVGGTIIEAVGSPQDVARLTGADHATIDIDLAVSLCQDVAQTAGPLQRKPPANPNVVTRLQVR